MHSPSGNINFRASVEARGSLSASKMMDDPLVMELLTENELMLAEIDSLRGRVEHQSAEIDQLRAAQTEDEARRIRENEQNMRCADERLQDVLESEEKKVAVLRPILDSLVRLQFDMAYFAREKCVGRDEDPICRDLSGEVRLQQPQPACSSSSSGHNSRSGTPTVVASGLPTTVRQSDVANMPTTLGEANAQFEHLYRLLSSIQSTPSFRDHPYDTLTLDALKHIIAVSKTLNAMVYAAAEREREVVPIAASTGEHGGGDARSTSSAKDRRPSRALQDLFSWKSAKSGS